MSPPGDSLSIPQTRRVLQLGRPLRWFAVATVVALACVALAVADGHRVMDATAGRGPAGFGGLWLLAVLGLADDAGIERLIEKVRRVEAGETDVEFETDRDGDVGRLYDAVGDLADSVAEREAESTEGERYRRELYEITADRSLDDDEKIHQLLELGRERFDLANGLITSIDEETGHYEIETAVGTDFVEEGTAAELLDTFCRKTVTSDDVLGIYNATEEGYEDDPGYAEWGISCYLGGKVLVNDELYGTVCFVDPEPRAAPFTAEEKVFADLMSRWISHVYERRERERELRQTSERLGAVIDASPAALVAIDTDCDVELWNPAAEHIFGWREDEVLGEPLPFVPPDCEAEFGRYRERLLDGESLTGVDMRRQTKDGELIDVRLSAAPIRGADGDVVGILGAFEDVSDRKARERELERYREYTDDLLDAIDDVFYVLDEDGRLRRWNETMGEVTGYSDEVLAGMDATELFEGDDERRVEAAIEEAFETGEVRMEAAYVTADGQRNPYEFAAVAMEDLDGEPVLVGIGRDVSERVESERELERARRLLEQSQRLTDVGGWEITVEDGEPVDLTSTEEVNRILGLPPDSDTGHEEALDNVHPEDRSRLEADLRRAFEDGEAYDHEVRVHTADGDVRWVRAIGDPVVEDGETVAVYGSIQDVTDRTERERELERIERRYQAILDDPNILVGVLDTDGTVRDINETAMAYVDVDLEAVRGEPFWETPWWEGATHVDDVREWIDRAAGGEYVEFEADLVQPDGEPYTVHGYFRPVRDDDGDVVSIIVSDRDITERVERERELSRTTDLLARAEEMADVGGWSVDTTGEPPFQAVWTDKLYDLFELPPEAEPPTMDVFEYYHPEDRDRHEAALQRAMEEGGNWDQELRLVTAAGTERWVRNIGETVVEDGEVVEIRGSIQDVTERKEREEALRERERELQAHKDFTDDILDAIDDVFYVIDDEGNFVRWNESLPEAGGYTDEYIAETNALEFFPESHLPEIVDAMETVFEEGGSRLVEAPILTSAGEAVPYEFVAATAENPDGETVLAGIGRDISERKRREAALERTTELLGQAQRIAAVGGWEFDVAAEEFTVTDEFRRLHGLEPDDPVSLESVVSQYHPDDREYVEQTFEETIERAQGYDMEVRITPDDESTRWARALGEPVVRNGEVVKLRGSVQDITEAKEHEQALRALHETAEGLLQRESATAIADLVVGTAEDILDVDGVCLYLLAEATNRLEPTAHTAGFAANGAVPPVAVGDEDNPVWNSFATSTRRVLDEGDEAAGLFPATVGGALVVPVGDHGVLAVTTGDPGIDARTRRLVETLVATTEAALDRLESEAAVRERDEALADQNRRLRRQIQLTDVIRRVDQSLIGADSREAVETAVTEELAGAEDIDFAWIGAVDAGGEHVEARTWAGNGESYLDAVSLSLSGGDAEPAARVADTGEPTVVSNVVADLGGDGWRKPALDSGFTSVLAVPIALEEYGYGVLAVYAGEPDAFGDLEREVFAELGRTIASAINAVQTREALHADRLLELRLDLGEAETVLAQVARGAGCPVEYVGTAGQSAEGTRLFFTVECDASDTLADLVSVREFRELGEGEEDGRRVYEAMVTGDALPARLIRHGASPESIRATPSGLSVVVHVPTGTDVREFVEMLRESYSTVELEGRQTVERPTRTRQQVVGDLLADLTERQREVLRTAYYAGFFDWPRDTTGEELAAMLDVTQPTVSRHLRLGQQRLLAQLFDEEVLPATA